MPNPTSDSTYEVTDFEQEVLEASKNTPVLVDFWAPWCGPCKILGPTLERLAGDANAWKLVKVNTDQNQELAREYGIRGIPAVKLFSDGAVVDEFTGAMPEPQLRRWLEESLPSEARKNLERARTLLSEGNVNKARRLLEDLVQDGTDETDAYILLARAVVFDEPERALDLLEQSGGEVAVDDTASAVQTIGELLRIETKADLPNGEGKDAYWNAIQSLKNRNIEESLDQLIDVVQSNRYYNDDAARKACIALFNLLGPQDDLTRTYRRKFDMALY